MRSPRRPARSDARQDDQLPGGAQAVARCARPASDRRDTRARLRRPHRSRPEPSAHHAVATTIDRGPHAHRAPVREPAPAPVPRPGRRPDPPVPAMAPVPDRDEPARRWRVRDTRRARSRLRRQRAPDTDRYPDERLHADEDAIPYVADELPLMEGEEVPQVASGEAGGPERERAAGRGAPGRGGRGRACPGRGCRWW